MNPLVPITKPTDPTTFWALTTAANTAFTNLPHALPANEFAQGPLSTQSA